MSHRNARLTVLGRRLLIARVCSGRPVAHVVAETGISRATAHKWLRRWRTEDETGLADRSSRPPRTPHRTPAETEADACRLRTDRKLGPARIGPVLGPPASNPSPPSPSSTPGGPGGSGGAELSWPLTTRQNRHRFATTDPVAPPQPGDPPRTTEERLACHSSFVAIRTPAIHTQATQVRTLTILGPHQQTPARPSLIVTGPAAAGKPAALPNVGRTCHLAHTRENPPPPGSAHAAVPVAYALVPPGATAKTLTTESARYLATPVTARMTQAQITDAVCHTYTSRHPARDDRRNPPPHSPPPHHHRHPNRRPHQRPHRTPPPTFVHACINTTDTSLFTGTRGTQLTERHNELQHAQPHSEQNTHPQPTHPHPALGLPGKTHSGCRPRRGRLTSLSSPAARRALPVTQSSDEPDERLCMAGHQAGALDHALQQALHAP